MKQVSAAGSPRCRPAIWNESPARTPTHLALLFLLLTPAPPAGLAQAPRDSATYRRLKAHLDAVTERAAAPVIAKYTGVLAAADIEVFTRTTTFQIMQSLRLDHGVGVSGPAVHP